jgi:hypothetical protein
VVRLAVPALIVTVPMEFAPSLNVTDPVANDGVNVAVKVTEAPNVEGLSEEVRFTDGVALFTTCVSTGEVLVL